MFRHKILPKVVRKSFHALLAINGLNNSKIKAADDCLLGEVFD